MKAQHSTKPFSLILASTVLALSVASGVRALQVPPGVGEGWMGEFDHAARQLTALAEATPAEKFDWRPAPGVRSIGEVYMHIAIGNHFLLRPTGAKSAADIAALGKDPEKGITDKAAIIKFMKESFDAVRAAYGTAERQKKVQMFKKDVTVDDVFLRLLVHNHEHMGQAVAYARMNGIKPPWSS